jgi:hypothetical protein
VGNKARAVACGIHGKGVWLSAQTKCATNAAVPSFQHASLKVDIITVWKIVYSIYKQAIQTMPLYEEFPVWEKQNAL